MGVAVLVERTDTGWRLSLPGGSLEARIIESGEMYGHSMSCDGSDGFACMRLIKALFALQKSEGIEDLLISVDLDETRLRQVYERLGWKPIAMIYGRKL